MNLVPEIRNAIKHSSVHSVSELYDIYCAIGCNTLYTESWREGLAPPHLVVFICVCWAFRAKTGERGGVGGKCLRRCIERGAAGGWHHPGKDQKVERAGTAQSHLQHSLPWRRRVWAMTARIRVGCDDQVWIIFSLHSPSSAASPHWPSLGQQWEANKWCNWVDWQEQIFKSFCWKFLKIKNKCESY